MENWNEKRDGSSRHPSVGLCPLWRCSQARRAQGLKCLRTSHFSILLAAHEVEEMVLFSFRQGSEAEREEIACSQEL